MKQADVELSAILRLAAVILAAVLVYFGYNNLGLKGVFCILLGTILGHISLSPDPAPRLAREKKRWGRSFLLASALFLLFFPFWPFAQSVGIAPGILVLYLGSAIWQRIHSGKELLASAGALLLLLAGVWIWAEAGKNLFVVMPVDIPETPQTIKLKDSGGASLGNDVEFTPEGAANALETEIYCFGQYDPGGYSETEAAQTLALGSRTILFPRNPWYKKTPPFGSPCPSGGGEAPQTPHVLSTTQIEEFPLAGIYHILRHIRGKPMIESQILVGNDDTLTLALRRANYPPDCVGEDVSASIVHKLHALGDKLPQRVGMSVAQANSAHKDAQETLHDMAKIVRDSVDQSADLGLAGCRPPLWREVAVGLDILPPQVEEEERIANQTIYRLQGDTRLTELIQFAVLEGMEKLSEEKLAHYYDETARYDSSLQAFERALPQVLAAYNTSYPAQQEEIVERLTHILIRIGDMGDEVCGDSSLMKGAYAVAEQLSREDAQQMTRMGYHYLIDADKIQLQLKAGITGATANPPCSPNYSSMLTKKEKRKDETPEELKEREKNLEKVAKQYLTTAVSYFEGAVGNLTSADLRQKLVHRYGAHRANEAIRWLYSNFAFANAMLYEKAKDDASQQSSTPSAEKEKADALLKKAQELAEIGMVCRNTFCDSKVANASLSDDWDIRTASSWAVVERLTQGHALDNAVGEHLCAILRKDLTQGTHSLTLNGYILVRDELRRVFQKDDRNPVYACPIPEIDTSYTGLLLLSALKEYRDANYDAALQFASQAVEATDSTPPSATKAALGYIYALTASQVRGIASPDSTQADLQHAATALAKSTPDSIAPVEWQASNLVNIRKALELDPGKTWDPCPKTDVEACAVKAVAALSENAYAHRTLGIIYLRKGTPTDTDAAIEQLGIATRINRGDPILRYLYGVALCKRGSVEEANVQWNIGRLLDPQHWDDVREFFKNRL